MGCTYITKDKTFTSKQSYMDYLKSKMISINPNADQSIKHVSDMASMLFNTKLKNARQYRREVYKRSFVSQVKKKNGEIKIGSKTHKIAGYNSNWDDSSILAEIEKKGLITEAINNINKSTEAFIDWVNEGASMDSKTTTKYFGKNNKGQPNFDRNTLKKIKDYFGIQSGDTIMSVDELLDGSPASEIFSDIDSATIVGHNTSIVFHGYTDGVADISIINIEPDLFFQGKGLEGKLFTSKYASDSDAKRNGVDMNATMAEVRSLQTSLLMAKLKKAAGDRLAIRKSGSIALSPFNNDAKFIGINAYRALKNLKSLRKLPDVTENFSDDMIADIFDDSLMNPEILYEDFISMLLNIHQQQLESLPDYRRVAHEKLSNLVELEKAFKVDRNHYADLLKALRIQQEYLRKRLDLDTIDKMAENDEYRLISQFIFDIEKVYDRSRGDISNPNFFEKFFTTEGHMKNWVIQQYTNFEKKVLMEASKLVAQEQDKLTKYLEPVNGVYIKARAGRGVKQYLINDTEGKMKNLFKTRKVKVKRGDSIVEEDVFTGEVHYTLDDPQTARLYAEGKITDVELELGEYVANKSMEYLEQILFQHIYKKQYSTYDLKDTVKRGNGWISIEDIITDTVGNIISKNWTKGMLPLLQKNATEYISGGKLVKGLDAFFKQELDPNKIFDQVISMNDEGEFEESMGSFVTGQIMDAIGGDKEFGSDARLNALGFVRQEEGIVLIDEEKNDGVTRDIFTIMSYMAAEAKTKAIIENEVLPFLKDAKIYAKVLEKFEGESQTNTIDILNARIGKTVFGKSQSFAKGEDVAGKKFENLARLGMRMTTFSGVALSIPVAVTSLTANYFESLQFSIANSFSNPYDMFNFKEFNRANVEVLKNLKKASALGELYQIYEAEMQERMNNPKYNKTRMDIYNSNFFHGPNRGTDKFYRMVTMVAQMMHDGSYDAHTLNENGEIEYNPKEDKRFYYKENGQYKQTKKQKALMDWYVEDLQKDRTINQAENELPIKGYAFADQEKFIYVANEFVIGAFDQYRGTNGDNYVLYNLTMQFKKFFVPKFQARFGTKRPANLALRKMIEGDDGELRRIWDPIIREGTWTSTGRMVGETTPLLRDLLYKIGMITEKRTMADWKNMNDLEKHNLVRAANDVVYAIAGAFLYYGLKGLGGNDDDDNKVPLAFMGPRLARALRDGLWTAIVSAQVNEMFLQPFPAVESAKRWIRLFTFEASGTDIKSITPGAANITAIQDALKPDSEKVFNY